MEFALLTERRERPEVYGAQFVCNKKQNRIQNERLVVYFEERAIVKEMRRKNDSHVLDVVVQLHSFRNIDMVSRGVYVIRVECKGLDSGVSGTPYAYFSNPWSQSSFVKDQEIDESTIERKIPCPSAHIGEGRDGNLAYISRGFIIKYHEERLELNEGCQFRVEIPKAEERLEIRFELFVAEVKDDKKEDKFVRLTEMSLCANFVDSLHTYYPVTFTNFNFCQLDVTLHAALVKSPANNEKALMRSLGAISIALQSLCDMGLSKVPSFEQGLASCSVLWAIFVSILPQHRRGGHMRIAGRLRRTWLDLERKFWLQYVSTSLLRTEDLFQAEDQEAQNFMLSTTKLRLDAPEDLLDAYNPKMLFLGKTTKSNHTLSTFATQNTSTALGEDDEVASALCHQTIYSPAGTINIQDEAFPSTSTTTQTGPHLIVLQHGWFATSLDMRLLQSYVKLLFPKALAFSARSNQENSNLPIATMGERLAQEIRKYVTHNCPALANSNPNYGRISFIGHSIGSMIIRAAITSDAFEAFRPKLHTFITLNSSHCGNKYMDSALISGGMWTIMKMHKTDLLEELQMTDAASPENSYIYTLSQNPFGIALFKYVVLVATKQDSYVPVYSAHIHPPSFATDRQSQNSVDSILMNMVRCILSPIISKSDGNVIRLTLDIEFKSHNVNTLIGRAGHVTLLQNPKLVTLLLFSLYNILR